MMSRRVRLSIVVSSVVAALLLMAAVGFYSSTEALVFQRCVLKPIPKSVSDIKVDRTRRTGRRRVLRFTIDGTDAGHIVGSKPFEEFQYITFAPPELEWGRQRHSLQGGYSEAILLYRDENPPEWFTPNDWDRPRVYRYLGKWGRSSRSHIQVFIHNEQLGEAYFIECVGGL